MNEGQPKKRYYVQLPGYQQGEIWDEDKFNRNKDQLFRDHEDAIVLETSPMAGDNAINDNDAFTVHLPDYPEAEVWDGAKLARNREKLLQDHPDVEIYKTSQVNYWGDKLSELTDREQALKKELGTLPAETDAAELRNMDDEDLIADAASLTQKNPGLRRRREIGRELEQIYRERENNPAWKQYWASLDKSIDEDFSRVDKMQSDLDAENPEAAKAYRQANTALRSGPQGMAMAAISAAKGDAEYNSNIESLMAARLMLEDAKKAANAPSRYADDEYNAWHDFWEGVKGAAPEALSEVQLHRAGLNMHLVDALKKIQAQKGKDVNILELVKTDEFNNAAYLNTGQKELVKAFVKKAQAEGGRGDTISRSYQSGQSAAQSVGFMADFYMFGGAGEAVADKVAGNLVKKAGTNELARIGAESLYGLVKAASMTPLMPSTYNNFMNNIFQFNDAGGVDLSGKAMLKAAGDVIIENISETIGSKPLELIGLPLQSVKFPNWAKALRSAPIMRALKQAGYNGFFEEMFEEWFGNALRVVTGVDKDALKDFATIDQQLITAGAFAPMSLFGLPTAMWQYSAASKEMKQKGVALEEIMKAANVPEGNLRPDDWKTPEELAGHLGAIYKAVVENGGDAAGAYKAVMEYAKAASAYKVMDGVFNEQKDIDRSRRLTEIDAEMGTSGWRWYDNNDVAYVRTITDQDGNESFVMSKDETGVALQDKQGNRKILTNEQIVRGVGDGTLKDSGEMFMSDYLDQQTEAIKETRQAERMAEESQKANKQLSQQAQPGVQINMGTVESPEMATILGVDGGSYIVQKADGTTVPFTPQEMAAKLGIQTTPKTDAQIEEENAALEQQREDTRKFVNSRKGASFVTDNGENVTLIGVTKGQDSLRNPDGSVAEEYPYDVYVTNAEGKNFVIGMTQANMDNLLKQLNEQPSEQETTPAETIAEETPAAPVDDNIPRDFRGNALPMRVNKQTGLQVVDENALWNNDPEAWARWNDSQPVQKVSSKEKLEFNITKLAKEIEKDAKAIKKAALEGVDADEADRMEVAQGQKVQRLATLKSILDKYNMPAVAGQTTGSAERQAQAEAVKQEQQAGFPGIQQKWNATPKVVGAADEIRLPNGETVAGHYVLTEAAAPTPSHDPANGFAMTEGFPVDENGKTVNDRDYQQDKAAQASVLEKAASYDQRALQTPVIVSADGVVLSGNDRTMASQLAAANNTDTAYTEYLSKYSQKYGFAAEQVAQFQHPRVVFVPDAAMPYNAATFAKFNAEEKKSQNKTEKAVKAGKTLTPETLGALASLVDRYDDINALYNDAEGVDELLNILLAAEVISQEQVAALKDGNTLSGQGMDLLESTLIGAALDEDAVRVAMQDKSIRKSIVTAISQIIIGNTLDEYNLRSELTDAINLIAAGKAAKEIKFGETVQDYIRQQHLFQEDVVAEATVQLLADAINDRKTSNLKRVLSLYNRDAVESATGQMSLLTGDVLTRESILRNILEYLGYDTSIIYDNSERAEQAGPAEAGQTTKTEQTAPAVQGNEGGSVSRVDRETAEVLLDQGGVGELIEYMTDEEVTEYLRLMDEFQPANDALGQAYVDLEADLKSSDKKVKKAAQEKIDELEAEQEVAFEPVQDYIQGLIEKYGLEEELGMQNPSADDEIPEDTEDEEPEPDEPKPTKGKKGSKKSSKKAEAQPYVVKGGASEATIAKQTYTQEEYEEFIYGYSTFTIFESKKTGEQVQIYMVDDTHPVYHDHRCIVSRRLPGPNGKMSEDGHYTGQHTETHTTTDYLIKYLKANKFKPVLDEKRHKKPYKNKYGYWVNQHGVVMNPIRIELPSVKKGWANYSEAHYYQDDNGKWYAGGSASYGTGGGTLGVNRGPYDSKSAAIRATIEALEYFRKNHPGNHTDLRDVDNLIRNLKTKTLPQALLEEGVVDNVQRIEFDASAFEGETGSLFGDEPAVPAKKAKKKAEDKKAQKASKKKADKTAEAAAEAAETPEGTELDEEPIVQLEDEEGTPGNFHWVTDTACTNPIVITLPGEDRLSHTPKIVLAEKDGKWYESTYLTEDKGKGTAFGSVIPTFKSNNVPYPSKEKALNAAVEYLRWLLDNPVKKQQAKFGETFNKTKELIDFVLKVELPKTKEGGTVDIAEAMDYFGKAMKIENKASKVGRVVMVLESYKSAFGDEVEEEIDSILTDLRKNGITKESKDEMLRRAEDLYNRLTGAKPQEKPAENFIDNHIIVAGVPSAKKETKPAYGSQNTMVTTEKYEELKRKMMEKLGNLNAGFDPEMFFIGAQMAVYHVEAGARKFIDFAQRMIADLGDAIRPYLKAIYNGARDLPGMEQLKNEMTPAAEVDVINPESIGVDYEDWKKRIKEGDVWGDERVVSVDYESAGGAGMITTESVNGNGRYTTSIAHFYEQVFGIKADEQETQPAAEAAAQEKGWRSRMRNGEDGADVQGFDYMSEYNILDYCDEHIRGLQDDGLNIRIVDMKVIGSRAFGMAREDSDLDVLVEYEGDMKEDEVFNALNAEPFDLLGIKVDFFPIRSQESGTMTEWLASHDNGRPVEKEPQNASVQEINVEGLFGAVTDMYRGKRSQVKLSDFAENIQQARENTDTNPTDAQKKAGNYAHGHLTLDGYDISIENPKGSVRSGKDANGNEWSVTMNNDYGYIRMTEGVDGDHIDVFLSDNPTEGNVFVVDQVNPDSGEFDEHKVMYGFETAEQARDAYLANYSPGWKGLGTITEVSKDEFKKWIESSHRKTKPFADYKSVNALGAQSEGDVTVENASLIERYARENFTKISDLTKAETDKAISIFNDLWNKNGEYEGETNDVRRYVADEYGVSQDYQNFLRTWDNHLVFISNGNLYQLDLDFAPAGGRSHLVARRYYVRDRQAWEKTQELIRLGAPFRTEEAQPSESSGQTVGEIGKYTHTKTGREMAIVRLTGDRLSSDEFKRLKERAREFGGYYSSYGGAKGFLFETEEDAIKFNTLNTTDNASENTDKQTAADTAVISSQAASVASKAEALAESSEPAEPAAVNRTIQRIDDTLDKIDGQLALLGYYEADTSDDSKFHESYGFMKTAEKKAVKDADRLAKKLAADLGIDVGRKQLAKANIAPAGGDISFRLPLNEGRELYVTIDLAPKLRDERIGGDYMDDLYVGSDIIGRDMAIMFRLENPNASGQARYEGSNNFAPYNVTYADLLSRIRSAVRNYLPEAPAETTTSSGPVDVLQVAKEQAEKSRKSAKKSVSSQEDGDAVLGGLFDTLYEAEDEQPAEEETPTPAARVKPTEVNGFSIGEKVLYTSNQGKGGAEEATIYDFEYDGRPVLDTGLAPVLYEVVDWNQISKIENEPVNTNDNGLERTDAIRTEGLSADDNRSSSGETQEQGEAGGEPEQESGRPNSGGEGTGGLHSGAGRSVRRLPRLEGQNKHNYRASKNDAPKTPAARFKANIAAIRLLKELQDKEQKATKEQMAVLAQYTGWGGLGGYFNNVYSPEYRELKSLLTDEELQAAELSINTAYYTPSEVIDAMWSIAGRLGFEGGNILEGSAGIGKILANMPKGISEHSAVTAVELDNITGGILALLYPDANVQVKGFEEVDIPNGSIDLAITNVPFGDIDVYDSKEKDLTRKFGGKIHDFCIAKNIRKLRDGGIGIFISTRGTLDGSSRALRQWIINEGGADVIGAFRLNNATFEGTKATSDIIVVRKRVNGKVSPNAINVTATDITRKEDYNTGKTEWNQDTRNWEPIIGKAAMEINTYFVEHPENMGGVMGFGFEHNDSYRPGSTALWPSEKIDQLKRLNKWVKQFSSMQEEVSTTVSETESVAEDTTETKEGQLVTNSKGDICISRMGKAVPLGVNTLKVKGYTKAQCLSDYNAIKKAINEVLDYQQNNETDDGLKPLLAKLNRVYDQFVRRYGNLNKNVSISFLRNDVDFAATAAIEDYKETKDIHGKVKVSVKKTNIFNGRVLGAKRVPTPTSARDGVIVSMNQFGRIDIDFIANALNQDADAVRKEIITSGLGYENPVTNEIEVEYEYLSGNVREKLEYAKEHNSDGHYDNNIKALEKVIPADIPAHLIEFALGSDWLPTELYTQYAKERFGVNDNFVPTMVGGSWLIPENEWEMQLNTEQNRAAGVHSESLSMDKRGHELMLAAMNNSTVRFQKTFKNSDGTSYTEEDKAATQAASAKISDMRDDFREWAKAKMLAEPELSERISKIYNDTFNAIVPKQISETFVPSHFDGQVLTMGGKPFSLYPHQAKAVIRATTEPLMMAHEVGAGKTFTLITTAMEMRRLGTAKKPMIVVQNATLGQFVTSAKTLYPNAKVLTLTESDHTAEGRSAFYAKIKYNDWDIIIIPQSVFNKMPDSEERKRAYIQEKIDEKMFILQQAKEAKNSTAEKQLKKELEDLQYEYQYGEKPPKKGKGGKKDAKREAEAKANAVAKAKKQLDRSTDEVSDFDDMGIDALLVDEAHEYKHLGFSTAMQRGVKGVDPKGSKRSASLYLKTRAIFDKVGWKNVVFATGTPISNTAAEIWTFMKYLMPADEMRKYHIYYFDDFVRNFGSITQNLEFTTSGKFKETTRFSSYTNLPELVRIWWATTDVVLAKDAAAAKAEDGTVEKLDDKRPKMEGGQAKDIYLPQSPSLVDIMTAVRAKLEWYEGLSGKEKKENQTIPIRMFGIAKMAAIDPRMVDRNAPDEPTSKTNMVVKETLKALADSKDYNGTVALFSDNKSRWDNINGARVEGFNIFEEIKRKLVEAGVPEEQIAIMKGRMSMQAKEKIFARVNSGDIRVIMGTTATLGTGVNIQERLFMAAHIDAPNRPMDYTQRNGRILRQGNLHKDWGIPVRVVRFGVEDSLDVTAYQRLATKAKFIDSVMDGKPLLVDGMANRVLEEEDEGEFDNPVAVLSGSEYAMLKSQAERELRKLRNRKEQYRQDQIYIERTLKDNKSRIDYNKALIAEDTENLAKVKESFPDGVVKEITIEGRKVKGAEQIAEAIKEKITGPIKEYIERNRNNSGFSASNQNFKMTFDGVPVDVKVEVHRNSAWDDKSQGVRVTMNTYLAYTCPSLGINGHRMVPGGYMLVKDVVTDFTTQIATGSYFEKAIANLENRNDRLEADNKLMLERRGKPFADEEKLAKQEEIVKDYTEKMKAEMAEKEAKYAEMAKNATTNFNLDDVEIDDDDEDGEDETSAEYEITSDLSNSSGIEDRREDEGAFEFTKRVVKAVEAKYPALKGKIVAVDSALTLTLDEQSKSANGLYSYKNKKIVIFAKENRVNADAIERTIFHEAIHMAIHTFNWRKDMRFINFFNIVLSSGYYSLEDYREVFADLKAMYEENKKRNYTNAQIREEMVAHEMSLLMEKGLIGQFLTDANESVAPFGEQLEKVLKTIGYEPEKETDRLDEDGFISLRSDRIAGARQRNVNRRAFGHSGSGQVLRDGKTTGGRTEQETLSEIDRAGLDLDGDEVSYELVTDDELINRLESGNKKTGYRNVVMNADGTLGSPMAGKLGKRGAKSVKTAPFVFGKWEQAEENPDMATEDGKINLIKPDGQGNVDGVAYNPYIHIRPTLLNKQFTGAWKRDNLVYIETQYPESELTSGYRAEKAAKTVGLHDWNGGELILSRWDKPKRVVSWEKVADEWEKEFAETGVTFDIVPPGLLPVLASRGVTILPPKVAAGQEAMNAYNEFMSSNGSEIAADLYNRYDNQNGENLPWMSEMELFEAVERELPRNSETKPLFDMIERYRQLEEEDFMEGRRDYAGGEMTDLFNEFLSRLNEYGQRPVVRNRPAYHGSGASFSDFDSSHMGEGEGAQAHGWGHYVSLRETTARGYAEKLSLKDERVKEYEDRLSEIYAKQQKYRDEYVKKHGTYDEVAEAREIMYHRQRVLSDERYNLRSIAENDTKARKAQWKLIEKLEAEYRDSVAEVSFAKRRAEERIQNEVEQTPKFKKLEKERARLRLLVQIASSPVRPVDIPEDASYDKLQLIADACFLMRNNNGWDYAEFLKEKGTSEWMRDADEYILKTKREDWEFARNFYTVDIPDDNGKNYLDEEHILPSEQFGRIYDGLQQLRKTDDAVDMVLPNNMTQQDLKLYMRDCFFTNRKGEVDGAKMYGFLKELLGSKKEASLFLSNIGFVGIKYDGYTDGPCAVIFKDSDMKIVQHDMFREGAESAASPVSYSESMGGKRLAASETARKAGVEISFLPSSEMQFKGKPLAGRWIDGKMYICLEHCRDANDAIRTVLHEGVGHNGLRRLIGNENMRAFCLDMFRKLPERAREAISQAAITRYGGNVAESVEEYLAERAEVMDFENADYERNFWDIVRDGLRTILAKIGINVPLSERDVRWLMWQSYNANKQSDVLNMAKRQVVAYKLGFTLTQQADKAEAVQISRNKIAEQILAPAARIYNKDVLNWMNRLHETWVDKDDAVHLLVNAIEKATGKVAKTFEDVRLALNQQSSKGLAAIEKFERECWEPMQAAIKSLMIEKGCDLHDVERYVMIKHGLERNDVFAKRDAKAFYRDEHDARVDIINNSDKIDDVTKLALIAKEDAKLDKHLKAVDAGTDVKYKEFRNRDYGGLTALYSEYDNYEPFREGIESEEEFQARVREARHPMFTYMDVNGREQVDMAAMEEAAQKEVSDFENGHDTAIDNLWKRINAATKHTLKHQYDANMMSREQYLGVSGMFKYYVPLRGFADNTAEDMYEYYQSDQRNDFTPPLQKAKGRTSEAESPFGYIGSMASSGIAADMKNETKLALYYFVSNRANNDLVTISEVWYKVTGVDDLGRKVFSPVYPPLSEDLSSEKAKQAYEDWEKEMKEEAKAGFAFKSSRKLNLHNSVIHIDKSQEASHIIRFKVGGRDMMMYINGNPRAAQAINNELNVELSSDYQKVFGKILRWFSGINTSYNPEFWLSNAQRDALFALMSVNIKEDSQYNEAFRRNFGDLLLNTLTPGKKGGAYSLKRKLDSGELGDERLDKLYKEFVENGGVTGYTTLKNNEEWELELRKYTGQQKQAMQAIKRGFEAVQHFGEAIEQMTRFAAYITSREQGKEIKDAVNDAKELTVNFNRKGSGKAITFKEAGRLRTSKGKKLNPLQKAFVVGASWLPVYGRRFIMFFNASVQGLNAMYKLFKKDNGKMGYWAAGYLALGAIQALIHGLLDDDDEYLDIPDYERRNNLLVGTNGVYFKWALPQECRVFYGLGDMIVNHAMGREPHRTIAGELLASLSDIAPLNPAGGITAVVPSAVTPIAEVALNRDYKGAKIYNDMRYLSDEERKRTPAYQKAYQGTGKVYVLLSQFANWLSGGDYADAGWLNINPAAVEHILKGATGGAGTTLGKLYRGTVGQVLGEDFAVRNTPFLSRLLTVTDERYRNAHTTELFDYYKAEAEHTKKLINTYRKNGDGDKLDKVFESKDYEIMTIYESYRHLLEWYNDELKATTDKNDRKALMREQDAIRKEMILEISNIGKND